jgi:hypothetical protein
MKNVISGADMPAEKYPYRFFIKWFRVTSRREAVIDFKKTV